MAASFIDRCAITDCDGEETSPSVDNNALASDAPARRIDLPPSILAHAPSPSYLQTTLRLDTPPPRRHA